ncbi:restriction endonuclease subunit S [Aliarcobacter skirrowii]|uniref:restriction endonuclease subunit S n=1 Tax=Aliarcobacter skirrowii TaxID=28200 RepID=UPI003209F622
MWTTVRLKSLGSIQGNGVDKTVNRDELPIKLLNYMDVYTYTVIDNNLNFQEVTAKKNKIKKCNLIESDVLFTPSSETPDDIAHASVVVEDLDNVVYSYHVIRFRFHEKNKIDKYFLRYCLNQYSVQKYFTSRASGTTRYTLSKKDFENLSFQIPTNKQEQKAIGTILSKVDEAIETTKQSINSAQKLKTSLMQNLLTGKIKPDGTKRKDDEFYYDEKLGKLPNDWEVKTFKEISSLIKRGKSPTYANDSNGIVIINQKCIGWDTINFDEIKYHVLENAPVDRYLLDKDILINSTGTGTIGRVTQFYVQEFDCLADSHVTVLRILDECDSEFFKYYLMSYSGQKFLESYCFTGSTNQLELSRKYLSKLRVAFPKDKQEQEAISEVLNNMKNNIEYKQNKIKKLENLKKSLMQNLLTGKMRLSNELIKILGELSEKA